MGQRHRWLIGAVSSVVLVVAGATSPRGPAQGGAAPPPATLPTSAPAPAPAPATRRAMPKGEWLDPDRGAPNGTRYQTFVSKALDGREVSYLIYLPPGYDRETARRYPVIYWLHGWGGSQRSGATFYVPHVDAAIKQGTLPPVIVVLVNGMGWGGYVDAPNGQRPIESVIIRDLVPHVDATYRTLGRREARVIEGYSMGGFGAGHLGFKYPELFGTVVINAGALMDAAWRKPGDHPRELARLNADALRGGHTHVRIGCGSLDSLLPDNRALHATLQELGIEHEYFEVPDVAHDAPLFYKNLGEKRFELHRRVLEALNLGN
jgi:endo-1,4-beta-xylanase